MTHEIAALAEPDAVRALVSVALDALATGVADRGGPLPRGGPDALVSVDDPLPAAGVGAAAALAGLTRRLAAGAADPADPWCAAHLHCPPLAVAAAADLVASVLNPSMDSWDQAPAASALEVELTRGLARLCHPGAADPDALVTTGGTESNLLGLLLARENLGRVTVLCGRNAHHSVARAAWLLGLREPVAVDCSGDRLDPAALAAALAGVDGPTAVVATMGTTNTGALDPLPEVTAAARAAGSWLHVDAAYAGALLFSDRRRDLVAGLAGADSVAMDLHKFGWQPIAAGLLTCADAGVLGAMTARADYLSADDDTEAGLPDLLGRSLRTSRRPDAFKIAVTLRALGRSGVGAMIDHCCDTAAAVAAEIAARPDLLLWGRPTLSTVVFRPAGAADEAVARLRRDLLLSGQAVLGRATLDGRLWLKLTLLHPYATADKYRPLLDLVAGTA
ncbi:pyridoxal phosphate-dependent decarboxylase family protein [Actinokineospora sp. G85]|uniref:pyridoxal phosphate-dependent decarboxylase family protein n=1 Tax=Actinokineospora sp. G85 TaxID=3406626 RepID=UPI003C79523F